MKPVIMIAGCSYSAVSQTHPSSHWSEILSSRLGWDLINLARPGCSNGAIRLQIEKIRLQRPCFAIISPTFPDRIEIPANPRSIENEDENWYSLQQHLRAQAPAGYCPALLYDNINIGQPTYRLISETIFSLAQNHDNPYRSKLHSDQRAALKYFISHLYDSAWKLQQDQWIITDGILKLWLDGIDFVLYPGLLWAWHPDQSWYDVVHPRLPRKYIMGDDEESILSICGTSLKEGTVDPGYHGDPQSQIMIADNLINRIRRDFNK
jgi:hypothetical protein